MILESAFVKYLKTLNIQQRAIYLTRCFIESGEMAFQLAEEFNEYNPTRLAMRLEDEPYGALERLKQEIWSEVTENFLHGDRPQPVSVDDVRTAYFDHLNEIRSMFTNEEYAFLISPERYMFHEEDL